MLRQLYGDVHRELQRELHWNLYGRLLRLLGLFKLFGFLLRRVLRLLRLRRRVLIVLLWPELRNLYMTHKDIDIPNLPDPSSDDYRKIQAVIREEFARMLPLVNSTPRYLARSNYPRSVHQFDTYEAFLAQPYRGPVGEDWAGPVEAAEDAGPYFSWKPFIVGTLVITDVRLISMKENVIGHISRQIVGSTVLVEVAGNREMAPTDVFLYFLGGDAGSEDAVPVIPAYGEQTLADIIGNQWRYEYDGNRYVACSPAQAKRNWLQGKVRYEIGARVGDEAALIADLYKLIKIILSAVQNDLSDDVKAVLAVMIANAPDLAALRRLAARGVVVKTTMHDLGYSNVSDDPDKQ